MFFFYPATDRHGNFLDSLFLNNATPLFLHDLRLLDRYQFAHGIGDFLSLHFSFVTNAFNLSFYNFWLPYFSTYGLSGYYLFNLFTFSWYIDTLTGTRIENPLSRFTTPLGDHFVRTLNLFCYPLSAFFFHCLSVFNRYALNLAYFFVPCLFDPFTLGILHLFLYNLLDWPANRLFHFLVDCLFNLFTYRVTTFLVGRLFNWFTYRVTTFLVGRLFNWFAYRVTTFLINRLFNWLAYRITTFLVGRLFDRLAHRITYFFVSRLAHRF